MRHTVDKPKSKTSTSRIAVRTTLAGRYARLRMPRTAMRHTEDQLSKFVSAFNRCRFPPVVIGYRGLVLAGFAQAQMANESILGRYVLTTKYSEMTRRNIRDYAKWMKEIARRRKWDKRMLAIELQYLKKAC